MSVCYLAYAYALRIKGNLESTNEAYDMELMR